MTKPTNSARNQVISKSKKAGRPLKMLRQLSVTSNKVIDCALELMVLQGMAKTRENAATQLLNSAANKFIKNNRKIVANFSLDHMLEPQDAEE